MELATQPIVGLPERERAARADRSGERRLRSGQERYGRSVIVPCGWMKPDAGLLSNLVSEHVFDDDDESVSLSLSLSLISDSLLPLGALSVTRRPLLLILSPAKRIERSAVQTPPRISDPSRRFGRLINLLLM